MRCQDFQALVDTAAEDAVCGSEAFARMEASLQNWNLRPRVVKSARHLPCAGIGGEAEICKVVDVPTNVAGVNGIIRFTIIQDSEAFQTPPLLPVSYLEAVRAIVNFDTGRYHLPDGRSDYMVRLPTGHRAINILNFDTCAWQLPDNLSTSDGQDPYALLDRDPMDGMYPDPDRQRGPEIMQNNQNNHKVWRDLMPLTHFWKCG